MYGNRYSHVDWIKPTRSHYLFTVVWQHALFFCYTFLNCDIWTNVAYKFHINTDMKNKKTVPKKVNIINMSV